MAYYEAPDYYTPHPLDPPAVFLAGGITGCPRWHDAVAAKILENGLTVFNPNRKDFPIDDPLAGPEQVMWEQHHLHLPRTLTLFWFPASDRTVTTQPIAMFELGQALGERRPLVVGTDPGYPRAADVRMLVDLARPGTHVYDNLAGLTTAAIATTLVPGMDPR